jgi:hypothetical protein
VQLKISKRLRACAAAEAVELLAVNANEVAEIAAPAQDGMESVMQPGEIRAVRTDTNRITIGLRLRRTARKIRRLKGVVGGMCPAYSDSADPRLPDALQSCALYGPKATPLNAILI